MKLTYIFHSGFVIEGDHFTLITDYFRDTDESFVHTHLPSFPGRVYVLASHWHPDHFNAEILKWKQQRPDIQYIFSGDILRKRMAQSSDAVFLVKGETWRDEVVCVRAFGSTDVGVSFLIEAEGKRIFHAGDLNNWHWNEESTPEEVQDCERHFLEEVAVLAQTTDRLDLAMFPVDARLGKDYMRGAEQFVERIRVGLFAPMHFTRAYDKAEAFRSHAEPAGCRFAGWKKKGDSIDF
ncbi:MAG: MBL fold metallo-hydrolase [Tannerella sp.]|jgi:L-ascorbate metabolism protein UlaG (beta-lactamase superfamily)|nr:MBL fold metallo-hydrolase [Tannerella sp.]